MLLSLSKSLDRQRSTNTVAPTYSLVFAKREELADPEAAAEMALQICRQLSAAGH